MRVKFTYSIVNWGRLSLKVDFVFSHKETVNLIGSYSEFPSWIVEVGELTL